MPNGGSDNCGTCGFNAINKKQWISSELKAPDPDTAFCLIRNFPIIDPFYTYCLNRQSKQEEPEGPIYSTGLVSPYVRIPWFQNCAAKIIEEGKCDICGCDFKTGLQIKISTKKSYQFCTNGHYVTWWKKKNPGVQLAWDFESMDKMNHDKPEDIDPFDSWSENVIDGDNDDK